MQRSHLLLVAFYLLVSASPAHAQAELRYRFQAGDKIAYTMEQKATIKTEVAGKQSDAQIHLLVDWTFCVVSVGGDGKAVVNYKVDRMRSAYEEGVGAKTIVDSDDMTSVKTEEDKAAVKAMRDKGITMTMDALGQIDNVKFPPELEEQFKKSKDPPPVEELVRQLFTPVALVFPREAVARNAVWKSKPFEGTIGRGKLTMQTAFTDQGTVQPAGKPLHQIGIQPTITAENAGAKQGEKAESQGDGTILFDNASGRVVATTLTLTTKMSLDAGGGMTVKMTTRETRTLKVRPEK